MIPNRTIIGNRGSGKSVSLEQMMTEVARDASVLLIDWPGNLADRMVGRMWEMGLEGRLVVDKALWTDKMPRWRIRPEPSSHDPLRRAIEERESNEQLLSDLFSRRYQKDGTLSPNTHRSALAALGVYHGIAEPLRPPIAAVTRLFRPRDPLGQWMLEATADREAAAFFRDAARLAGRSPQQWEYLLGAGGRLLSAFESLAVWPRHGHSLDWQELIAAGRHFYLGMEGLSQTTATTLAVLTYAPAIHAAKALAERTGQSHPLVVVLEEAGALGLVTPTVTLAMQAYRKYGVAVWLAAQTVHDFRDAETFESVLAMSEHYWHQMASGVERAAADCAAPTFDPDRVLHRRERHSVRRYDAVSTETVQVDAGGRTRGRSYGTAFRPLIGVDDDPIYDNPANHEAEYRRLLSTLKVGERVVRGLDGAVRRETVPLPPDPWGPFADEEITLDGKTQPLGRHRLEAALARIRTSPLYLPPPVWTPPSPAASVPTPTPTPPTAGGPSGMRGS